MPIDIKNLKIGKRYAQALMELKDPREILSELEDIREIFAENMDLKEFLEHPAISINDKKEITEEIFKDKISQNILNFLYVLIEERRTQAFETILECLKEEVRAIDKIVQAKVTSVIELDDAAKERLMLTLEEKLDTKITLEYELDQSLIGGFTVKIQDKMMDLSTRARLSKFESRI